jgi:hypothetical protein
MQPFCGQVRRSEFVFLSSREAGHPAAFGGVSEKLIGPKVFGRVHDEGHFFNFSTLRSPTFPTASGEGRFPAAGPDYRGPLVCCFARSQRGPPFISSVPTF